MLLRISYQLINKLLCIALGHCSPPESHIRLQIACTYDSTMPQHKPAMHYVTFCSQMS